MAQLPESAKKRALRLLERRDYSRKELILKLTEKGEPLEDAEAVADRMMELGVINDERYSRMLVRHYASKGYGVLRNTFLHGVYDFGKTEDGTVSALHNENEFDAYYFLSDGENITEVVREILAGYYHVTGAPVLLPEYAFYEAHLNAYNRDSWTDTNGTGFDIRCCIVIVHLEDVQGNKPSWQTKVLCNA